VVKTFLSREYEFKTHKRLQPMTMAMLDLDLDAMAPVQGQESIY
jgi:hypothetical protein